MVRLARVILNNSMVALALISEYFEGQSYHRIIQLLAGARISILEGGILVLERKLIVVKGNGKVFASP